jgi:hypothetical protein
VPRKAATVPKEPPSLPEVLISPSQAAPNEKDAYWIQLAADWQQFSDAIKTEEWDSLIAALPEALWGETLRLYLYRKPDDQGVMVKNPPGEWKYLSVFYRPVELQFIQERWGGGKYEWRLNWVKDKENRTIKRATFDVWGDPKVKTGQIVEVDGKPVSIAGAAAHPTGTQPSETTQIMSGITEAARTNAEIMKDGMKSVMELQTDLTRKQLGLDAPAAKDPVELAIQLVTLLRPAAVAPPAADPVQTKLMEKIIDRAFAPPPAPVELPEREETTLEAINSAVQTFTGKTLAELGKGGRPAAPDTEFAWVAPVAALGEKLVLSLPTIIQQWRQAQHESFERAVYARSVQGNPPPAPGAPAPGQPALPPRPAPPAPGAAQPQPTQPHPPDRPTIVQAIVARICQGFDRHRDSGEDIGAAISVEFGEFIEAMGLEEVLTDHAEMTAELMKYPQLAAAMAQRTTDARWQEYIEPLAGYMEDRWGEIARARKADVEQKPGPQAVETPKPPAA